MLCVLVPYNLSLLLNHEQYWVSWKSLRERLSPMAMSGLIRTRLMTVTVRNWTIFSVVCRAQWICLSPFKKRNFLYLWKSLRPVIIMWPKLKRLLALDEKVSMLVHPYLNVISVRFRENHMNPWIQINLLFTDLRQHKQLPPWELQKNSQCSTCDVSTGFRTHLKWQGVAFTKITLKHTSIRRRTQQVRRTQHVNAPSREVIRALRKLDLVRIKKKSY